MQTGPGQGGWIVIVAIFLWPSLSLSVYFQPDSCSLSALLCLYKVIPDPRAGYEALLWSFPRLRLMSGPAFIMWQRLEFHPFLARHIRRIVLPLSYLVSPDSRISIPDWSGPLMTRDNPDLVIAHEATLHWHCAPQISWVPGRLLLGKWWKLFNDCGHKLILLET